MIHPTKKPRPLAFRLSERGYCHVDRGRQKYPGSDLLSHQVTLAVPSAVRGLTAGFGMDPGVSPSLWPPEIYSVFNPLPLRWSGSLRTDSEREQRSSPRTISTGRLNTLLCLHLPPINAVVFRGPYLLSQWEFSSWSGLRT